MTDIVVNDASCLIDLRKGDLLSSLTKLPYRFVVPLPVRESEVLDFSENQWHMLETAGLITHDLTPDEVGLAIALKAEHPALSANDCFCHVTAKSYSGILLTGDGLLRKVASQNGLRVHGVLWIVDELHSSRVCSVNLLTRALRTWLFDDSVFLPEAEISSRLAQICPNG